MKYVYVIQDNVSCEYSPLFMERNERAAKRQFADFLSRTQYAPSSYDLYIVAAFCEDTIQITDSHRLHICNGAALEPAPLTIDSEGKTREEALNYVP